ncbi:isochorismate synthase [Clostridium beijerinckii]|uniref:isochorismate synthase n=1 Tax=Clostridium beijerinckii TaxID=1520 RepID=A0AAE5H4K7_CLOBE|nr:isochorismate synthase [Clostridium beijerinckii]NRT86779.1 isochorismate synthase [Clostridium beijerinckii]NSB14144.1 isochorismate synthase [Clostridium beijerinckii]NYC72211.1 isochorismate synthase [Clostridium beijerinckii]OOM30496.1 isochorismate synthase DhbC [Clostridium beijerinckii]
MEKKVLLNEINVNKNCLYFSTPEYELYTEQICDKIDFNTATNIPKIVEEFINKGALKGKMIVGAIPFDLEESGCLYVTNKWEVLQIPFKERKIVPSNSIQNNYVVNTKYVPTPERYMKMVEEAVKDIKGGSLDKIVLSRGVDLTFEKQVDVLEILKRLCVDNEAGYTYATNLYNNSFLVGASPEMLVSKRQKHIYSNPLAGSRPRGINANEDKLISEELMTSTKDQKEHKFVVNNIVDKISKICKEVTYQKIPVLIKTKQLWHLSTLIEGTLKDLRQTVLEAAITIHPTPAICGVPQSAAYKKIAELEGYNRGLFTGIIGWCDENGDGDWAIVIRGAQICPNNVKIRAGAGIVQDSEAVSELEETKVKFRTMLNGLGMNDLIERREI